MKTYAIRYTTQFNQVCFVKAGETEGEAITSAIAEMDFLETVCEETGYFDILEATYNMYISELNEYRPEEF